MLIMCHLSYQDSVTIVRMKQNAIVPTEHQYSRTATETLMIDTCVVGLTRDINRFSHVPVEPFWEASHAYHCFISSLDSGVGST